MKTKLLIEQHFHGAFGVDFNTASVDDVLYLAKKIFKYGIGGIFPTLVTDSVENIRRQTQVLKTAAGRQTHDMARILGIHLEGIFINPLKKGIHDEKLLLPPEKFSLIADDFIKIITFAPELFANRQTTPKFIPVPEPGTVPAAGVAKLQAGHCTGADLSGCDGVTHIFNAMEGILHRAGSTALSALIDDRIYTEVIADGTHLSDDILRLVFKTKPADKILLVSDSLPIAGSDLTEMEFAGEKIFYDGVRAVSKDGVLAGSTMLLPDIIRLLAQKKMFNPQFIENPYNYHKTDIPGNIEWDENFNIVKVSG